MERVYLDTLGLSNLLEEAHQGLSDGAKDEIRGQFAVILAHYDSILDTKVNEFDSLFENLIGTLGILPSNINMLSNWNYLSEFNVEAFIIDTFKSAFKLLLEAAFLEPIRDQVEEIKTHLKIVSSLTISRSRTFIETKFDEIEAVMLASNGTHALS